MEHAGAQHEHVRRCRTGLVPLLVDDLVDPPTINRQQSDRCVTDDGEVEAVPSGSQVCNGGRLADAVLHVRCSRGDAEGIGDVPVGSEWISKLHRVIDERLHRRGLRPVQRVAPLHGQRALLAVVWLVPIVEVGLDTHKDGKALLVGPAGVAQRPPGVQVMLGGPHDGHHVYRRPATYDAPAERVIGAAVDLPLRGVHHHVVGFEDGPVTLGAVSDDVGHRKRVGPGLQEQHLPPRILRQPGGRGAARRASSHHDYVIRALLDHVGISLDSGRNISDSSAATTSRRRSST